MKRNLRRLQEDEDKKLLAEDITEKILSTLKGNSNLIYDYSSKARDQWDDDVYRFDIRRVESVLRVSVRKPIHEDGREYGFYGIILEVYTEDKNTRVGEETLHYLEYNFNDAPILEEVNSFLDKYVNNSESTQAYQLMVTLRTILTGNHNYAIDGSRVRIDLDCGKSVWVKRVGKGAKFLQLETREGDLIGYWNSSKDANNFLNLLFKNSNNFEGLGMETVANLIDYIMDDTD